LTRCAALTVHRAFALMHPTCWFQDGAATIDYHPVHEYTLTNKLEYIAPNKRGY
jgi:succinate dehydrogenase / fumarate reductase flavoprotein subunit